jgi:hypothetical protein
MRLETKSALMIQGVQESADADQLWIPKMECGEGCRISVCLEIHPEDQRATYLVVTL